MTKKQFEDLITVNRNDRYEVIYFISNTLNFILNGSSWYCYGEKIKIEKDGVVSTPRLHSGHCQSCRNLNCFLIWNETSTFNMTVLNKYYDQLFKELVKLFEEHSEAVYCFHGGEYVYGGHDWLSGKYWRVTVSQSIRYADGIILAQ